MLRPLHRLAGLFAAAGSVLLLGAVSARAAWTSLSLPNLTVDFGSYQMAQLSDGRLVFATDSDIDRQTAFQISGAASLEDYANAVSWVPSSVSVFSDTLGVVGKGSFGASQLFTFDPSNLATPFTPIPNVSLQDYTVLFRDASSLYVGGLNGTGGKHAVSYVALDGTSRLLIDDVSTYSGAMALDAAGNLFVTDNDDLALYEFPAAQLSLAIATNHVLTVSDGNFLTTLHRNSSLSIDALGRVWTAGFQGNGLEMFDPGNGLFTRFTPALANTNYVVSTFTAAGTNYVAYLNASGFSQGSAITYGFDRLENLVPEPASGALLLAGLAVCARRRRR